MNMYTALHLRVRECTAQGTLSCVYCRYNTRTVIKSVFPLAALAMFFFAAASNKLQIRKSLSDGDNCR